MIAGGRAMVGAVDSCRVSFGVSSYFGLSPSTAAATGMSENQDVSLPETLLRI